MKFKGKEYVLDYVSGPTVGRPRRDRLVQFTIDGSLGTRTPAQFDVGCWDRGRYRIFKEVRRHHNTSRKTARERAVYVINRGAMAEDIEKQIQLAVEAYAKRKARR